jgi:hypothetical protein
MQFNFKTYFKNVDSDGQGISCLDFHMEVIDTEFRDQMMQDIMKLLAKEPPKEEKPSALGFDTSHQEEDET